MNGRVAIAAAAVGGAIAVAVVAVKTAPKEEATCGAPFVRAGAWRCCDTPEITADGACAKSTPPAPRRVRVPDTKMILGPADWEAEGRVAPRAIAVRAFYMDAEEATEADVRADAGGDRARAASGVSFDEAQRWCASRGARVPSEDEWIAAAAGDRAARYPWGDTGAVCRRAAWGLASGPCASGARGPDSVGAHPDGRSPLGLDDLAGNVAEWTIARDASGATKPVAHGGSWQSALATELRTWARLEVDAASHDPRVGVRCASDTPDEAR